MVVFYESMVRRGTGESECPRGRVECGGLNRLLGKEEQKTRY